MNFGVSPKTHQSHRFNVVINNYQGYGHYWWYGSYDRSIVTLMLSFSSYYYILDAGFELYKLCWGHA